MLQIGADPQRIAHRLPQTLVVEAQPRQRHGVRVGRGKPRANRLECLFDALVAGLSGSVSIDFPEDQLPIDKASEHGARAVVGIVLRNESERRRSRDIAQGNHDAIDDSDTLSITSALIPKTVINSTHCATQARATAFIQKSILPLDGALGSSIEGLLRVGG